MSLTMVEEETLQVTEALLVATPEPLTQARFAQCLERSDLRLEQVIGALQERFDQQDRPVEIVKVAGGYQLVTRPAYEPYLKRLFKRSGKLNLSRAALEVMAVVAYKQPVTRSEIDQVRGVSSDSVVKTLLEKKLVTVKGRDEGVGRPLLYGTTQSFLEAFGLATLSEMPKLKEIEELMGASATPTPVNGAPE